MTGPLRLVATDLDGTLLRSDRTVNAWTRSVLDACRARDVLVVPVTARQPVSLRPIAEQCGMDETAEHGWALCSNGALGINLVSGEVLFERLLAVDVATTLAEALAVDLPEVRFVAVRDRGDAFVAQEGYAAMASFTDHHRDPASMGAAALSEVLAEPNLKLVLRHPQLAPAELLARVQALGLEGVEPTVSGADFVEVSAAGVTKATGLALLCEGLGIQADQVAAFGDAHNDIAMLRWAGTSYAMDHADDEVKAAATGVAGDHDDDGVARTLMDLMRSGRI
ncbi:HAD family hydrolase [Luteococcus peritonei]|uniref:HAD family hydrolase n=1 Tax=Luteococcus peritonei TaxID=88874 RepID=A0ABW4RUQ4_9ACTN